MRSQADQFDECLALFKRGFENARNLNKVAHADILREVNSMLGKEMTDIESFHTITSESIYLQD